VLGTIPEGFRPVSTRNYLLVMRGYGTDLVTVQLSLINTGNFEITPLYGSISAGTWYFINEFYM